MCSCGEVDKSQDGRRGKTQLESEDEKKRQKKSASSISRNDHPFSTMVFFFCSLYFFIPSSSERPTPNNNNNNKKVDVHSKKTWYNGRAIEHAHYHSHMYSLFLDHSGITKRKKKFPPFFQSSTCAYKESEGKEGRLKPLQGGTILGQSPPLSQE